MTPVEFVAVAVAVTLSAAIMRHLYLLDRRQRENHR